MASRWTHPTAATCHRCAPSCDSTPQRERVGLVSVVSPAVPGAAAVACRTSSCCVDLPGLERPELHRTVQTRMDRARAGHTPPPCCRRLGVRTEKLSHPSARASGRSRGRPRPACSGSAPARPAQRRWSAEIDPAAVDDRTDTRRQVTGRAAQPFAPAGVNVCHPHPDVTMAGRWIGRDLSGLRTSVLLARDRPAGALSRPAASSSAPDSGPGGVRVVLVPGQYATKYRVATPRASSAGKAALATDYWSRVSGGLITSAIPLIARQQQHGRPRGRENRFEPRWRRRLRLGRPRCLPGSSTRGPAWRGLPRASAVKRIGGRCAGSCCAPARTGRSTAWSHHTNRAAAGRDSAERVLPATPCACERR